MVVLSSFLGPCATSITSEEFDVLKLHRNLATLVFPARCLGCQDELLPITDWSSEVLPSTAVLVSSDEPNSFDFGSTFDTHWCVGCWRKLNDHSSRCRKCAATVFDKNPLGDRCALCHELDLRFESTVSVGNYRGLLQELVIEMKNQHNEQLAVQLGRLLGFHVVNSDFLEDLDLVVPVPTHWWRRVKRGFHGTDILAQSLADSCGIPYSNRILKCQRSTKKQGTLSTSGRFRNVRSAFSVRSRKAVSGKTILLIDDVMTSGATTSESARILLREGADKVFVGVIARGARVS